MYINLLKNAICTYFIYITIRNRFLGKEKERFLYLFVRDLLQLATEAVET